MHHVLDDFLIVAPSYMDCKSQLERFLQFCAHICVPMAPDKTEGPSVILTFLGITLSTLTMQATLPLDKLMDCQGDINFCLSHKKVTKQKLQSVNGRLNFACSVVLPGRCFLRRMFALTAGLNKPYHVRRLNRDVREDLKMWLCFLEQYNGSTFFLQRELHSDGATIPFRDLRPHTRIDGYSAVGHMAGPKHMTLTIWSFLQLCVLSACGGTISKTPLSISTLTTKLQWKSFKVSHQIALT